MISIVRTIFRRLYDVDPVAEEAKLRLNEEESQHGDISMSVSADASGDAAPTGLDTPVDASTPVSVLQVEPSSSIAEDTSTQPTPVTLGTVAAGEGPPSAVPPKPCELYNAFSFSCPYLPS